jgi:hypothetical protein
MREGFASDSAGAVDVVVFVAGSPANLKGCVSDILLVHGIVLSLLIGHDYEESFRCVLVGLQLVVCAVYSCASGEEE